MLRGPIRLRTRLLAAMLGPLLAAALLLGLIGSWLIADVVERTNDRILAGALGAIAETVAVEEGAVTLDLPPAAFGMLENAEHDNVYYRIAEGPELLSGYADLPPPDAARLSPDAPAFRYAVYRGTRIRLAETIRRLPRIDRPVIVQVAETLDNRSGVTRRLLLFLLVGEAALVLAAIALLRPALGWSLRPLATLRRSMEERAGEGAPDLSPLDPGPLPAELDPLADAFNQLLARLDAATTGVRRFTADASHQMRTPLSVLKVQIALAKRGSHEALDEISDAVDRLERLLTQLLALARAQEAGRSAPLEAVDLREVSAAVLARRFGQASEAGIDIRLDAADDQAFVIAGHRTLLFELIGNLVDNAIRYNRPGGEVAVLLSRSAEGTTLAVEDDGPGIPPDKRAAVFERFVRLSPESDTGSGLGLAIVGSIATRLGARIALTGGAKGGVRVTLRFPPGPAPLRQPGSGSSSRS